jgi:branched-chain amino acid transport system permease protein
MSLWLDVCFSGLVVGSIYVLIGHAFNLAFLTSRVFNFAQAQIIAIASLLAYSAVGLAAGNVPLTLALLLGIVVATGVIGYLQERLLIRPTFRFAGSEAWLVSTLGGSIAIQGLLGIIWGTEPLRVDLFGSSRLIEFIGIRQTLGGIVLVTVTLLVTLALPLVVNRTRAGKEVRATAENRVAAGLRGINTTRLTAFIFTAAGALTGLTGIVGAPIIFAWSDSGSLLMVKVFVVLSIAGFGSTSSIVVAGFGLGIFEAVVRYELGGQYVTILTFMLLVATLLIRPAGLFARGSERLV